MVRVPVVICVRRELLCAAPVRGRQRLVPGAEDELRGIGGGVLFDCLNVSEGSSELEVSRETHSGDLMQLALDAQAESVQVCYRQSVRIHPICFRCQDVPRSFSS
jgi:hypothetical protein